MSTALTLHRTVAAPITRVWHALTAPAALAGWLWPSRIEPRAEVDLRVGGRYRFEATGMAVGGEYVTVDEPHRLVFTWRWDGDSEETLVTIELGETAEGTVLSLTHERFGTPSDRDNHAQGWADCLDRLPGWVMHSAEPGIAISGPEL